jgi:predicted RNase H-like nuclease (RuvC/YqgF family)
MGNTTWLKMAEMISNTHNEIKSLKEILGGQQNLIQELHTQLGGARAELRTQLEESRAERARMMDEIQQLREQLASSAACTNEIEVGWDLLIGQDQEF